MARREDAELVAQLARQVRTRREAQKLTQERVAELTGIKAQTLSRIETGRIQASIATVRVLARVLGCTMGDLLDGGPVTAPELSARERTVLAAYRSLGDVAQDAVHAVTVELARSSPPVSPDAT